MFQLTMSTDILYIYFFGSTQLLLVPFPTKSKYTLSDPRINLTITISPNSSPNTIFHLAIVLWDNPEWRIQSLKLNLPDAVSCLTAGCVHII